jgi:hypothetical protein
MPKVIYLAGTMTTTSPDGKTPYGPPKPFLVTRTLKPAEGIIEERLVRDRKIIVTTLTRQASDQLVFRCTDAEGTFDGTITFGSNPFAFSSWTYAISTADGGRIEGRGSWDAVGLRTVKTFLDKSGAPRARIVDELAPVDEARAREIEARELKE